MKIEYNEKNKVKKKMEKKKMKRRTRTRRGRRSNGEGVFIYLYVFVCGERENDIWVTSFVRQRTINLLMDLTTELFIYVSIY